MSFTKEEEKWLSETWRKWKRDASLTSRSLGFKDYMSFKWFFKDFERAFERAGIEKVSGYPPYYDQWDEVDPYIGRDENEEELERRFLVKFEEEIEEEVTSLPDLLKKLGAPSLPDPLDPYAPIQIEELVRELSERLKDAEALKGKVRVRVAGKTRIWGAKKVYQFVDELNSKIRSLEGEKARLLKEKETFREVRPIKIRILKAFTEGIIDYTAGSVVETRDMDWALDLIEKGFAERVPPEVPVEVPRPPKELTKEEIKRLENIFRATLSAAGLYPPRFVSEFRVEIEAVKFLPFDEAIRAIETLAQEIVARAAPPRIPTVPVRRIPYPYIPPALEAVELEPDFKEFLTECGITMEDYRRLEHVGKLTMREEYRRWKARPYSS